MEHIEEAFGRDKLGLIVIKNIPGYIEKREKLLKQGFLLANLREEVLKKYERKEANYHIGWSKARAYTDGDIEELTGHFYARIKTDHLIIPSEPETEKLFTNIWPQELPSFKEDFLSLGEVIFESQNLLMKHIDSYISHKAKHIYPNKSFENTFSRISMKENDLIGRLIVNFPANQAKTKEFNNWIGWHRDFGCITGLNRAMYFKPSGEPYKGVKSGLLIRNKDNIIIDLSFEEDEIALQAGDASFMLSGGIITATPHSVKITNDIPRDVFRVTYVNFLEPAYEFTMKLPFELSPEELFKKDPFKMMDVFTQWDPGCKYKDFIGYAIKAYFPN